MKEEHNSLLKIAFLGLLYEGSLISKTNNKNKLIKEEASLMIKAIIFDLVGVIVHTDQLHYQA